jgi:hypothetical protein
VRLAPEEERMRQDERGEAVRLALEQQLAVGEFFAAERFVPVTSVHMMHRLSPDPLTVLRTGDRVRMSPGRGVVELVARPHS